MGITPAATAALGKDEILTGGHVHDDLICFCITDHRTTGNLNDQRLAALAAHFTTLTVCAGLGSILSLVAEV